MRLREPNLWNSDHSLWLVTSEGGQLLGCAAWNPALPGLNVLAPPNSSRLRMRERLALAGVAVAPDDPGLWTIGGPLQVLCHYAGGARLWAMGFWCFLALASSALQVVRCREGPSLEEPRTVSGVRAKRSMLQALGTSASSSLIVWRTFSLLVALSWVTFIGPSGSVFGMGGLVVVVALFVVAGMATIRGVLARRCARRCKCRCMRGRSAEALRRILVPTRGNIESASRTETMLRAAFQTMQLSCFAVVTAYGVLIFALYEARNINLPDDVKIVLLVGSLYEVFIHFLARALAETFRAFHAHDDHFYHDEAVNAQ